MPVSPFQRAEPVPSRRRTPRAETVTYRIRVDLDGAEPPIWRSLELASDLTLDHVHALLQIVMGWTDSHLHEFVSGDAPHDRLAEHYLSQQSIDNDLAGVDESTVRVDEVLVEPGDLLFYGYDFGDDWMHALRLEAVAPREPGEPSAVCLAGARACPPEDCGGIWGYQELLTALSAPGDSGNPELLEWVGANFDPDRFDAEEVNSLLARADDTNDLLIRVFSSVNQTSPLGQLLTRLKGVPEELGQAIVVAMEPVAEPDRQNKAAMLRPYLLLLELIGESGITLTQAGYLPPVHARAVGHILHLADFWPGTNNREVHAYPVLEFRETAQRLGLLRKAHNRLTLTKAGAKARGDADALWKHLTAALPLGLPTRGAEVLASHDAGLLLLVAVAAGLPKSERLALITDGLAALGWRTEPLRPLDPRDVQRLFNPTENVLEHVGAVPRWTFRDVPPTDGPAATAIRSFVQAALRR